MLKSSLYTIHPSSACKSTLSTLVRTLRTVATEFSGEEIESCCETTVFPTPVSSDLRMRRVTPRQLSIAVSKRKKKSRPFTEQPQNDLKSDKLFTVVERRKVPRTKSYSIHEPQLRYDKTPIAEREALVSYVSEKLGAQKSITRPFQDAYTAPSVIGTTKEDIDNCFSHLLEAGFKKQDAAAILPYLPFSCLVVDFKLIKRMCDLLESYEIRWRLFLYEHCHCLLNPTEIVGQNLAQMSKMGMTPQVMGWVLRNQSMLFTCSLCPDAIKKILKTKTQGFNCMWVDSTLKQALMNRPAKVSLGPDTKQLVHILKQFKVSPEFVLRRHPSLFKMEAPNLLSILEVLCGEPFYLDSTLIAQILTTCPQYISSITSLEQLKSHLISLHDIFTATLSVQYAIRHINRTPSLISPSLAVEEKVAVFKRAGFKTEETSTVLNRAPSMLTQNTEELEARLRLLLNLSDSSPAAISKAAEADPNEISARFLIKSIPDLQSRVNYSRKYNEGLCSLKQLNDLFGTSDQMFASQFGHTGVQYLKEAAENEWLDNKIAMERISKLNFISRSRKAMKRAEADPSNGSSFGEDPCST